MKPPRRYRDDRAELTRPPIPTGRWRSWRARWEAFHLRDLWWRLLDFFEASRAARIALYLTATSMVAGGAIWFWAYPRWNRRNAIRIAQQWLDAGQFANAAEAAQRAAAAAPDRPEPWEIAAELARQGGQLDQARTFAKRAAELAPEDPDVVIGWAAAAMRADQAAEADEALDRLPVSVQAGSSHVQRLRGELARRQGRLTAARNFFEEARRLEGSQAINEVPLGLILLNARDPAQRQRGLNLLGKWAADPAWGATALRTLLGDALDHDDRPAMARWAEALRTHPACTVGDMPQCLLALATADPARFTVVLAALEKDHAVSPSAAAQLLSWLNQIGRGAEAVAWMKTLPPEGMQRPPLAVAGAEALRQAGDWSALQAWTSGRSWGPDAEFMRWAYGFQAAHMRGELTPAGDLWQTLYNYAQLHGAHAYFAGSMLYSWGREAEAVELWWRAAGQEGPTAIDALGSLARHYQQRRDAEGQYRVFRELHLLRPRDAAAGNNFAFFAALTAREERKAEQVAQANRAAYPENRTYLATCAFVILQLQRKEEALRMLQPFAAEAAGSPALGFAYGLALAANGRTAEARPLLANLPPASLTLSEVELIRRTLGE